MTESPADPEVEQALDLTGFELQRRLGAGGMAEVFLANKRGAEGTFKQLVVKRILPKHSASRRFRHMFVEEAHLATRLNHPNIVQVYEFSHHGDDLLLSMEYVDGVDLGQLMSAARMKDERIPYWVSAFIVAEVAKGLHYAHERKDEGGLPLAIVHRDVSPHNVLLSLGGVVKIADFGIASANLFREEVGVLKGKFAYMSPEQARGEAVDRRSDIYALGVVFYELLCGASPYGSLKDQALADAVRHGGIKSPVAVDPDIPPVLVALVMQALARKPEDRFQTAREFSSAVARALIDHQRLIDSASVEETITALMGNTPTAQAPLELEQQTMAAVRRARTAHPSTSGTARDYMLLRVVREVRHVAVVQLRLEGGERLQVAQGQAAAARAIEQLRATLNDIVYKRGAVMTWESSSEGYTLLGLGSNPSRAPNDAALLAMDIHDFLASHSEDLPAPVRASIAVVRGIATGTRDALGHLDGHELNPLAAFLASQLGRRTPFGKTWVAGGVYRLLRREYRWSDGPVITLEEASRYDAPTKLRVYALLRPLTSEERIAEMAANPTDLVGREAEKADLQNAYHRAVNRSPSSPPIHDSGATGLTGQLVSRVVIGEMGIGKTALADQFVAELDERCRVLRVECSPINIDLPYAIVATLLRLVTGIDGEAGMDEARVTIKGMLPPTARSHGDSLVNCLAELVTGTDPTVQDDDAAMRRRELVIAGVRVLLGSLAHSAPLVVVVDSLQWADTSSLELLRAVLQREQPVPVLALLLTRPDDRVEPYLEGLVRTELGGLDADDQVRLVQVRLGVHSGAASVCRELVPRVGGNPYFLLEMVDALLEKGALEIVDADDQSDASLVRNDERFDEHADALPSTIEQLVGTRLAELPSAEHDVVDWLAVAGGPLSDADLVALARLTDDEPITRLCARGLCDRRGTSVDFRHPLARDVAYQALDVVQRARMHRRLGEHFADTHLAHGVSAAIVAQHFERGETPQRAADLYLEAAKAARAAHQTQLALRYSQRALHILPPGDIRRLVAHDALERLYRHTGQLYERKNHLEALRLGARSNRYAHWIAVALIRSAQLDMDEGAMASGLPLAQRAADMARYAQEPELEVEALILLCELLRDLGDVNGALDACERALKVSEGGRVARRSRGEVLRTKGVLLRRAGRPTAALETHAQAIAIFHDTGAQRSEARARNALGFALFVLGRYEDCIAMCLSSLSIDVMIGGRFQVAKTLANIGMSYARLGDMTRGMAYLDRARDAHERYNDHDGRVDTLLVTASVLLENGQQGAATQLYRDAAALVTISGTVYDKIHQLLIHSCLARSEHNPLAAAKFAADARQLAQSQALVSYHVYATALEAAARVDSGDTQSGVLLATTALGAVEAMDGSEYGIEVRALCCHAVIQAMHRDKLTRATPAAMTADVCRRALSEVDRIAGFVRDAELRRLFLDRPAVKQIVTNAKRYASSERPIRAKPTAGSSRSVPPSSS